MQKKLNHLTMVCLCIFAPQALSKVTESIELQKGVELQKSADSQIRTFLQDQIYQSIQHSYHQSRNIEINIRLPSAAKRFEPCEIPLYTEPKATILLGNERWRIECGQLWSISASTNAIADIFLPISTKPLKRGQRLDSNDLTEDWITLSYPYKIIRNKSRLINKKLRRGVRQGQYFTDAHLQYDYDVISGQNVVIMYQSQSFAIQANGVATESAMVGDKLTVKNTSSGNEIIGELTSKGTVEVY
ncbi:flagellar basal body P-ring formation protein FlgA [Vibrio sp. S17_S38]|uniref:flagellar basal body P-ring formation chaperone FlgA n=1 Tax=Vibrio sp. S17_S38 TaxID=2720229 RepID=UPI001680117E|nr:flagellar basal body P-ring formation protein FlgA [Vibrio sp. S17_S38]